MAKMGSLLSAIIYRWIFFQMKKYSSLPGNFLGNVVNKGNPNIFCRFCVFRMCQIIVIIILIIVLFLFLAHLFLVRETHEELDDQRRLEVEVRIDFITASKKHQNNTQKPK